ncbi:hypothetical protein HS041_10500 [Planomonospora sp. ID67723]|uniref:hypothetical protein n=1 Tax=Planomonospora sp. ID67723 TaxID=2738134 RepID=UPI0018C4479D|nr:hypothetical protein [Planomonospora sp. ID67723]MBG0828197.1 hypothetical protein [Planomonospora sp. ID67723]
MYVLSGLATNSALPPHLMLCMLQSAVLADVLPDLAWRADLPEQVVDAFIDHRDAKVRTCFAVNPHVSAEVRSRLVHDPVLRVRWALAAGPEWRRFHDRATPLTDAAYTLMARDPCIEVRCELAQSWHAPAFVLTALAADPEPEVRKTVCSGWDRLADHAKTVLLADADPVVRRQARLRAYRERPELLDAILAGDDAAQIAGEAPLPRAMAESYARSDDPGRRHLVAGNPHLDRDLVEELSADPDPRVRLMVSLRPEFTEAERAAIAYDPELYQVHVPLSWIRDRFTDASAMARCARSAHVVLRRSVACNPGLGPDLIERLAHDDDPAVRLLLAEHHPDAPADLLLRVVLGGAGYSEGELTGRPCFPRAGLARFADSPHSRERRLVVLDPQTPAHVIERLSQDEAPEVRAAMARDPRLPVPRITALLHDPDRYVAFSAAANPGLPVEVMTRLVQTAGDMEG